MKMFFYSLSAKICLLFWHKLPKWIARFAGRSLGYFFIGKGWTIYPSQRGWSALNYKNFSGWFDIKPGKSK